MSDATRDGVRMIEHSLEQDVHPLHLLTPAIHARIRAMAHKQIGDHTTPTFDASEVAQMTVAKMLCYDQQRFANVRHFFGAVSVQIRRILIDRSKRNRPDTLSLEAEIPGKTGPLWKGDLTQLIEKVEELEVAFPEEMEVINLLCFVGCTQEEAATALGTTRSVVEKRFRKAKALLATALQSEMAVRC
jgi:DNA-directed RNA polymerase specialized sigma24 family protein